MIGSDFFSTPGIGSDFRIFLDFLLARILDVFNKDFGFFFKLQNLHHCLGFDWFGFSLDSRDWFGFLEIRTNIGQDFILRS